MTPSKDCSKVIVFSKQLQLTEVGGLPWTIQDWHLFSRSPLFSDYLLLSFSLLLATFLPYYSNHSSDEKFHCLPNWFSPWAFKPYIVWPHSLGHLAFHVSSHLWTGVPPSLPAGWVTADAATIYKRGLLSDMPTSGLLWETRNNAVKALWK